MKINKQGFFAVLLALTMVFTATACSADDAKEENLENTEEIDLYLPDESVENDTVEEEEETVSLPEDLPEIFIFSSGAGAWGSSLTLNPDGTFVGSYHDSEMGEMGDDYPNGTVYQSEFSGQFGTIEKINDWSYALTLTELTTEDEVGAEWIEDGIRFVGSEALGLAGGTEFILYTPEAPTAELTEEFLSWNPDGYIWIEENHETLERYAICNLATEQGFYAM